jgi:hypothetical protein
MERTKNIFDKVGSLIPGYSGYAERDGRRTTDKILRERIAGQLSEIEKKLYTRIQNSIKGKETNQAVEIDEVRKQLNTFNSQVKYAPYGVSGFFSDNQLKEDELLKIYQMDLALAESIQHLLDNAATVEIDVITSILDKNKKLLIRRNVFIADFK